MKPIRDQGQACQSIADPFPTTGPFSSQEVNKEINKGKLLNRKGTFLLHELHQNEAFSGHFNNHRKSHFIL